MPLEWTLARRGGVRSLRGCAHALVLAGAVLACVCPRPVEAQPLPPVGGMLRPIIFSDMTITNAQRQLLLIRPTLNIDTNRQVKATSILSTDIQRRFVLALHRDGAAYLWDLERGIRIDGRFDDVVAGVVRGAGRSAEMVTIHRDGSARALRLDGQRRMLWTAIRGFDASAVPAVSGEGTAMAFRDRQGRWHVAAIGAPPVVLPDAAVEARPLLSPDGSTVIYRASSGTLIAGRVTGSGLLQLLGFVDGCRADVPITAGTFTADGVRIVLGDARGGLCVWTIAGVDEPSRLFAEPIQALEGPVESLAVNRDGTRAAVRSSSGEVQVWKVPMVSGTAVRLASVQLTEGAALPLVLDTTRGWTFGGENDGTIAIHSYGEPRATERRQEARGAIGRLISTVRGWTVLDHAGRFDGLQGGINALTWSGETETGVRLNLSTDAFSESHFEPGLLAKLSAAKRTDYLTTGASDLLTQGYLRPPRVKIDPILPDDGRFVGEVTVTVRLAESDYPKELLAAIRLYHNEKLVPHKKTDEKADGIWRFTVRLVPGRNAFRAIGVGHSDVDGPPSPVLAVNVAAPPLRPSLHMVAIGIAAYPRAKLLYSRDDAEKLTRELGERSGGLFAEFKPAKLLDGGATRPAIEKRILHAPAAAHDVLVVYFSGHGVALDENGTREWYLLPFADEWANASSPDDVRRLALSSKQLMELLVRTRAQRVFLVLDSCFSGTVVEAFKRYAIPGSDGLDAVAQKSLRRLARVGGIHVLAATRPREKAKETMTGGHGALTFLVLESIRGEADGVGDHAADGQVSVQEIAKYTELEMPTLHQRLVQDPITHVPTAYIGGADFALVDL